MVPKKPTRDVSCHQSLAMTPLLLRLKVEPLNLSTLPSNHFNGKWPKFVTETSLFFVSYDSLISH